MRYHGKQTVETWQIILSAAGLVLSSSVLTTLLNGWLARRKTKAEANGIGADTGAKVVASAGAAADEWKVLYAELKTQVIELRHEIEALDLAKLTSEGVVAVAKELARKQNADLTEQVEVLRAEVERLSRSQAELIRGVCILTDQLRQNEIDPGWVLPEWMAVATTGPCAEASRGS